jgi:hypothetical protein
MVGRGGRGDGGACHIVIQNIVSAVGDGREGWGMGVVRRKYNLHVYLFPVHSSLYMQGDICHNNVWYGD